MPKTPELSIIIPVHNRHDLFLHSLNSVLNQKHNVSKEIIIVDEASSPPIEEFIKDNLPDTLPFVKIIRNSRALGPSLARTKGLNVAKGKFIAFLDSDDFWRPEFLSQLLPRFDSGKSEIVTVLSSPVYMGNVGIGEKIYYSLLRIIRSTIIFSSSILNKGVLPYSWLYVLRLSGMVFTRKAIGKVKFLMAYRTAEDWKFIWDCIRQNQPEIKILPRILMDFTYSGHSETIRRSHYWGYYYMLIDELTPDIRNSFGMKFFKFTTDLSVLRTKSYPHLHYYPRKSNGSK